LPGVARFAGVWVTRQILRGLFSLAVAGDNAPSILRRSPHGNRAFLIDFILHVDKHLEEFVAAYGVWVYALLFIIVFVETGVVVMPFLPGDSLLFIVGALCGAGLWTTAAGRHVVLLVAAVLGDQCNYSIGRYFGPKVFGWENSRWFNRRAFDQAHDFYERYGGITIVHGALHAVHPHLCALCGRCGRHGAQQVHGLQRGGRAAVGAGHLHGRLLLRQPAVGAANTWTRSSGR
jgi:membrane protein YqaA with SNARE-associated domain